MLIIYIYIYIYCKEIRNILIINNGDKNCICIDIYKDMIYL